MFIEPGNPLFAFGRFQIAMILRFATLGGILALLTFIAFAKIEAAPADSLADLSASISKDFPSVPALSTAELADWLKDSKKSPPILLDVREEKEYVVSHLPGARRAKSDAVQQLRQLGATEATPVVVYCSVGYRSAVLARKLAEAGFTKVRNLTGSIFAWSNEGRPLVNATGPTSGVHPFDASWGRYLEQSKWRWVPEN